jgi:type IV pilus assembly protein PilW
MDHRTVKVPDVNSKRFPMRRESGFTIVEMMVGVLIGLIAIVVMFQVFAVSEAQKRSTAGAGEAQQNGVTSLYLLEREARIAGYGIGYLPLLGCNTWGYYAPLAQKFNFRMAPVVITNGAGGTEPDKITVLYGSTDQFQMPGAVTWPTSPAAAKPPGPTVGHVTTGEAPYQFKNGDLIVLGEAADARPPLNPLIPSNCTMFQVTRQVGLDTTLMYYNDLSYIDDDTGASRSADFNPPLGIMPAPDNVGYSKWREDTRTGGRVTNLGQNPVANRYEIVNGQLISTNILNPSEAPVIISDGIVQLQAQYGYSSNCPSFGWTGAPAISPAPVNAPAGYIPPCAIAATAPSVATLVTTWPPAPNRDMWADTLNPAVTTPNNWRQIIAVRFVIVARSAEKERPDPDGQCRTTTAPPRWTGADNRVLDVIAANPLDWMCYRYRTFEGVVPIRNIIWSPDPLGSSLPPA